MEPTSRVNISGFVKRELEDFRNECNFTPDELEFFNRRARGESLVEIQMNVPGWTEKIVRRLSRDVTKKIIKVLP